MLKEKFADGIRLDPHPHNPYRICTPMMFIDIFYNCTMLIALSVVSRFINQRWGKQTSAGVILQGLLFGGAAVVGMIRPTVLSPGLIFDGRSIMISLCGLFFGPAAAILACGMAIVCRIFQGGIGALMGVLVILSSGGIGVAFHQHRKDHTYIISSSRLLVFGLAVHAAMLLLMFTLPLDLAILSLRRVAIPVIIVYPLATVVIGKILSDQEIHDQYVKRLHDSLAEKEILLREIHHRVKNNLAAIIGLIELHQASVADIQTQSHLSELSSCIRSMTLVHEMLYASGDLSRVRFSEYIQKILDHLRMTFGSSATIVTDVDISPVVMTLDTAIPCGMIVTELVTNAFKYAFPEKRPRSGNDVCRIQVSLRYESNTYILTVSDNGVGIPPSVDWRSTPTLGLLLVRMLGQHQLGGKIALDPDNGAQFTVTFSVQHQENIHGQ